jgi:hypothetical protein
LSGQQREAGRNRDRGLADLDRPALDGRLDQIHRGRPDESRDEQVCRPVVDLGRRRHLLQHAVAQHGDAVAHGHRLDLVVRHVHGRHLQPLDERLDLAAHRHAQLRVEVRQRFVHQERLRLPDDRATHRDALPLAAAELLRLAVEQCLDREQLGRLPDAPLDLCLRHAREPQAEGDVLRDRHVRVERVALEHHGDVAILLRHVVHTTAADEEVARADLLEPGDHPQRRGLPAPRRPDEHEQLSLPDLERQLLHRLDAVRVALRHLLGDDLGHASAFQRSCKQAADEVAAEQDVDDKGRQRGEQRGGHLHVVRGHEGARLVVQRDRDGP